MLVVYDDKGAITHCTLQAECTLEVLAERYREAGIPHLLYDGGQPIWELYVRDGEVLPKPALAIDGEIRSIKADGIDTLSLRIDPPIFQVLVMFEDKIAHQEDVTDGVLELATDHPGSYVVTIAAEFPWRPLQFTVVAT